MDAFLSREGDVWAIRMDGRTVRVRDSRGMRHLAVLLARPGREVHVLELAGAPGGVVSNDAAPLLDDRARREYRERLSELAAELDDADACNDVERSARVQIEIDALVDQLTAAAGLGGKPRGAVTDAERARVAVRRAVKSALDRIGEAHPALGAHLDATVRTGTFCSYVPDPASPLRWTFDDVGPESTPIAGRAGAVERPLLVGRDDERAQLRDAWRVGGIALVSGEPGIGKTTITRDLAAEVDAVLVGRCDEDLAAPYQPIVEIVRALVERHGVAQAVSDAGAGAGVLARIVPELGPGVEQAEESERLTLFHAITRVVRAAVERQRLLVIVEDVHWATAPTIAMLSYLLREVATRDLLTVLTYRDTEVSDELRGLLAGLAGVDGVTRIHVGGLDAHAVTQLGATTDEAKRLVEHTGGNPFFIRALLGAPVDDRLPVDVLDVVGTRVRKLSDGAQGFIRSVAIAGDRIDARLAMVLAATIDDVDEALASGLLIEDPPGVGFPHALVRRAITAQTTLVRRAAIHADVARALELTGGRAADLAHHHAEAGNAPAAVRAALRAAHEANRAFAWEETIELVTRTRPLAEPDSIELAHLDVELGAAQHTLGNLPGAREALDEASRIARRIGDSSVLADAAIERAIVAGQVAVHNTEIVDCLREALDAVGDADPNRRAILLSRLAAEEIYGEHRDDARAMAREAVALAEELGDDATLLQTLRAQYLVTEAPDELDARDELVRRLVELGERTGDHARLVFARGVEATVAMEHGDINRFDAALAALEQNIHVRAVARAQWYVLQLRVLRAHVVGDVDEALQIADRELAVGLAAGVPNAVAGYGVQLLVLRREQGRGAELADMVRELSERPGVVPTYTVMAALTAVDAGRLDDARMLLARVDVRAMPDDSVVLGAWCVAAEIAVALDDGDLASTIDELLAPHDRRCCVVAQGTISIGPVARYRSLTARMLGDTARAERHLLDAIALEEGMGSRRWLERDRADLAALRSTV